LVKSSLSPEYALLSLTTARWFFDLCVCRFCQTPDSDVLEMGIKQIPLSIFFFLLKIIEY